MSAPVTACGLDFGTSNTTLGIVSGGSRLVPLEGDDVTIPSAIFFAPDGAQEIGRRALAAYTEGRSGRLMRGLKSALGKALIDETTPVGRRRMTFREVIARYIAAVKARAEAASGRALGSVVHGRPVHFVDGDEAADRAAEETLAAIARDVGFTDVSFLYEPIAAALDYERQVAGEEIALIADIGGGTSDFSVVRLHGGGGAAEDRRGDILASGGVRVGGTDFDRLLSLRRVMPVFGFGSPMKRQGLDVPSSWFHDLATWSSINRVYQPKIRREIEEVRREARRPDLIERLLRLVTEERGHALAFEVEEAKIALSEAAMARIPLAWLGVGEAITITRDDLADATVRLTERLSGAMIRCIADAGLEPGAIDALFLTGGSTRLVHARRAMVEIVPDARIVEGDTFGSVGLGLTLEAKRRYG